MSLVIKLSDVGRASVKLDRWYRGLMATGEGDPAELAEAQAQLRGLPFQPGPLGRAVSLVASGGAGASDDEMIVAVELLCRAAARTVAQRTHRPRRRRSADQHGWLQLVLPGLDAMPGRKAGASDSA